MSIDMVQKQIMQVMICQLNDSNLPMLCQGGTAWAAGWLGIARVRTKQVWNAAGALVPSDTVVPKKDYVNVFDRPYTKDSEDTRPGIYLGISSHEYTDRTNGAQVSMGHQLMYRIIDIPIVIAVADPDPYICRDKRNQLRDNVCKIILANITNIAWWSALNPGESGGGELAEHAWMTDTGQGNTGQVEAFSVIPLRCKYSYSKDTPA